VFACLGVSLCTAEPRLCIGVDRPVRTRRVACADGSLTMITCGRGLETAESLRLTDGGKALVPQPSGNLATQLLVYPEQGTQLGLKRS
jgi:hypothetical protein